MQIIAPKLTMKWAMASLTIRAYINQLSKGILLWKVPGNEYKVTCSPTSPSIPPLPSFVSFQLEWEEGDSLSHLGLCWEMLREEST